MLDSFLLIIPFIVGFAKNNNINMSQLLEEALLNLYFQKKAFLGPGPGFEPGLGDPQSGEVSFNKVFEHYKKQYSEWLSAQGLDEGTKTRYLRTLERIVSTYDIKFSHLELKHLMEKEHHKRNVGNAIRSFLNFLADEEIVDKEIIAFFKEYVKPKKSGISQDHITDKQLKEAYKNIKARGEINQLLFELLVFTGLRLSTIVNMLVTYDQRKLIKVNKDVVRYPVHDLSKGQKRAFWAYMPLELARKLRQVKLNYKTVNWWVYYKDEKWAVAVSSKTIRKWFYTYFIRMGVPGEVTDFIQGRAAVKVGSRVYLEKTIAADEWYSRIVEKLKEVLEGS